MSPDDPRHGSPAGAQAHWRDGEQPCRPCADARYRSRKRTDLERGQGVQMSYSKAELDAVLEPWLALGLGATAVALATGLESQRGAKLVNHDHSVRRETYLRVAAVTEDDLHPGSRVWADLTRQRIYALMAAGHLLVDMPLNPKGPWRWRDKVTVETARAVRAYYAEHHAHAGPSAATRTRARSAGHQPPFAWDDPGTLAWPLGWTQPIPAAGDHVDQVLVQRFLDGDATCSATATYAERVETVRQWRAAGRSLGQLRRLTGWKPERYYDTHEESVA